MVAFGGSRHDGIDFAAQNGCRAGARSYGLQLAAVTARPMVDEDVEGICILCRPFDRLRGLSFCYKLRIQNIPRMIRRVLGVIVGKHLAFNQLEMVYGIHDGRVDAALVWTFDEHPAVVMFLQRCLFEEGAQHILVLHLAHAQDTYGAVLRHGQDGLVHIVAFLVETAFGPMLHAVLGESVVGPCAVDKGVEEILHVPEGDTDGILSGNDIINHKTKQSKTKDFFIESIVI